MQSGKSLNVVTDRLKVRRRRTCEIPSSVSQKQDQCFPIIKRVRQGWIISDQELIGILKYRLAYGEAYQWFRQLIDNASQSTKPTVNKNGFLSAYIDKRMLKGIGSPDDTSKRIWKARYYCLLSAVQLLQADYRSCIEQQLRGKWINRNLLDRKSTCATYQSDDRWKTDRSKLIGQLIKVAHQASNPVEMLAKELEASPLVGRVSCSVALVTDSELQINLMKVKLDRLVKVNVQLFKLVKCLGDYRGKIVSSLCSAQPTTRRSSIHVQTDDKELCLSSIEHQKLLRDKAALDVKLANLKVIVKCEEEERKLLHNRLQELTGNIRVCCRIRQSTTHCSSPIHPPLITACSDDKLLIIDSNCHKPPTSHSSRSQQTGQTDESKCFIFDRVFAPSASQPDVFDQIEPLLVSCIDGYNVCIMAYGQTGSGKTHTMLGSDQHGPGVIPRTIDYLFDRCSTRRTDQNYIIRLGIVEVYQETVLDLLSNTNLRHRSSSSPEVKWNNSTSSRSPRRLISLTGSLPSIDLRASRLGTAGSESLVLTNLTEKPVNNRDEILTFLDLARSRRHTSPTCLNDASSRSHLIVFIRLTLLTSGTSSLLTLVDLAGCEKQPSKLFSQSPSPTSIDYRFFESTCINKSLACLGRVFDALRHGRQPVYRESKLTRLLQPSLSGSSKCLLIVTLRSEVNHADETRRAIRFGQSIMMQPSQQRSKLLKLNKLTNQ